MDNPLIYFRNKDYKNHLLKILKKENKEICITCLSCIEDNILLIDSPLYFNLGTNHYQVTLDKLNQLKLIKLSLENNDCYPCIIHSHVKYDKLYFSGYDKKLEDAFNSVIKQMGGRHPVIMVLLGYKFDKIEVIIRCKELGDDSIGGSIL